ncbi:MAG: NUDIX hydrolase [Nitrososphaeraceae archaeon]|jgi:ADP-ribose pyrophosphatase YjhB (NUDIX family)
MAKQYKNPIPTVDIIIEQNSRILMIRRKNEPYKGCLALPGGFVNEGERIEDAATREANEETSLDVGLREILGIYSDPKRDPRGHLMSTVFVGMIPVDDNIETVEGSAQDDAAEIEWINLGSLDNSNIAFDHKKILYDYKAWKLSGGTFWSSKNESNNKAI